MKPYLYLYTAILLVILLGIGCAKYEGTVRPNQIPIVEFATTPQDSSIFNAAPVISWFGRDPDGFVEFYHYADIIDPAAIADPINYIPQIPRDAWVTTPATNDTIILLTTIGDTTEHIFYLKATDDRGGESEVIYRRFWRTNQPPNIPEIRSPSGDFWSTRVDVVDTMFCIDRPNNLWPGIPINWRGTDPDDRVDRQIELQYKYYLIKAPNDTIQRFVSQQWTNQKNIILSGLESGSYRFEVYSRDDGLILSRLPGVMYFSVIRPTFERSILVYMEGTNRPTSDNTTGILSVDTAKAYYYNLLDAIRSSGNFMYLNYDVNDPNDVTFYNHTGASNDSIPPVLLLAKYRCVLWMQDVFKASSAQGEAYLIKRTKLFGQYLAAGGRMMISGRQLSRIVFNSPISGTSEWALTRENFFRDYFGVELTIDQTLSTNPAQAEFVGANPAFIGFSPMTVDTTRMSRNLARPYPANTVYNGIPWVNLLERVGNSQTIFTFVSNTDTLNPYVENEDSQVIGSTPETIGGVQITAPPTPTSCLIKIRKQGILDSIISVRNLTKYNRDPNSNYLGEVRSITGRYAFISYQYGEPWRDTDTLSVTYYYRATSNYHLKPTLTAYEATQAVGNTGISILITKTVIGTFPWYFMDQTNVVANYGKLLNWLMAPPNVQLR